MFGNLLYGNGVFGKNHVLTVLGFDFDNIYYNGFDYSDWFCVKNMPDLWNLDVVDVIKYDIASSPGMGDSEYNVKSKKITVNGSIRAISESDLQDKITTLKASLSMYNEDKKTLYVKLKNGYIIQAPARVITCKIPRQNWTIDAVLDVTIVFEIIEPFMASVDRLGKSFLGITNLVNDDIIMDNSENVSNPKITITFSEATSVDKLEISVGNKTITINETINAGDVILLDPVNYTVSINEISDGIDRDGEFPVLFPGVNVFTVQPNGTYVFNAFISYSNSYV